MQMNITNRAIVPANRQVFLDCCSTLTTGLARASWVYCYELPSSIFRFLRQYISKLTPSNICNRLIEFIAKNFSLIIHHVFDIKFFNTDDAKVINKFSCFLVNKIMSPIRYSFVNANNNLFNLLSFRRVFIKFRQFSLSLCKGFLAVIP